MSEKNYAYPGNELILFRDAQNWKNYFASVISPFIKGRVLEAGAGIGSNTSLLQNNQVSEWTMLEPDTGMARELTEKIQQELFPVKTTVCCGTTADISQPFNCILYIDVLEHIEEDRSELERAASLLQPGGTLIVLSPAFPQLFSPFDKAIGHYRRYTVKSLLAAAPPVLQKISCRYYDSLGFAASLANKVLLRQHYPEPAQIRFWDRRLIPLSRIMDKLIFHSFGKSIIAIWKKKESQ